MFAWLSGPGKAFREPLSNSTNYLSAYDKQGQLLRAREDGDRRNKELGDSGSEDGSQRPNLEDETTEDDSYRQEEQTEKMRLDAMELERRGGIPREGPRDLRPYPLNRDFRSQAVLSEELREKLYELVMDHGLDLKSVSAAFGVDIRRVAAVVRLKSLERQWVEEGKKLATPYNRAILAMLPQTPYRPTLKNPPAHESINDLPVHPYTRTQIFVPTSESRAFTRADAAKAFSPGLLPADERIPHPELIQIEKWRLEGLDRDARQKLMREKDEEAARRREEKEEKDRLWRERTQVVVQGRRWDFKFQDISVTAESVGKDGRGRHAVGLRYGMPHEDRKRGQVKIPTKVE